MHVVVSCVGQNPEDSLVRVWQKGALHVENECKVAQVLVS
jgi:hypothetical protein